MIVEDSGAMQVSNAAEILERGGRTKKRVLFYLAQQYALFPKIFYYWATIKLFYKNFEDS